MNGLAMVALGGAVGAVGRYLVMTAFGRWLGLGFPYGTLAVNVIGSFALGALVGLGALVWQPSAEARSFLVVGLLGAFTTFSTFSLDVVTLYERGAHMAAGSYVLLSILLSVAALFAGLDLARGLFG